MTGYPWNGSTNRILTAADLNAAFAEAFSLGNQAISLAAQATTANRYTLPPATTSVLGGVKPDGTTLTAAVDGTLSVTYGTTINTAAAGNDSRIVNALSTGAAAAIYQPLLGYTAYNASNPAGYQTAGDVTGTLASFLASPSAIGSGTPASGAFTTLSASGAVSGSGFSAFMASPPALGGTAPSSGAFTSLSASGAVTGAGFTALLAPYATLASPVLTGTPSLPTGTTAVTQAASDNSTKVATTAYVQANLAPTALLATMQALIASLPTSLPATSGKLWNNGGVLSVS
jgi:hypothetical protein